RLALGAAGSAPRLLEESQGARHESRLHPRAQDTARARRRGPTQARRRSHFSPRGSSGRGPARAGPEEQGQGGPRSVTLARLLALAAERRPEAIAIVDGACRLTYADLATQAETMGRGLRGLGISRGDRVVIALKNRLEHVLAYWSLQTIGGVPVPVNFRLSSGELRYVLGDSGAGVALFESTTAPPMLGRATGRPRNPVFRGEDA